MEFHHHDGASFVVHDGTFGDIFPGNLFEPEFLRQQNLLCGQSEGRGQALFIEFGNRALVLRHFWRGGLMSAIWGDRYVWRGWDRSRPLREWRLLDQLHRLELPVPMPVAARVRRKGLLYSGDLLTERIPHARPLVESVRPEGEDADLWQRVGACIARFHRQGAWHADLNVRNILVDDGGRIWLIDWDRGRLGKLSKARRQANLARLHRSFLKWPMLESAFRAHWPDLLDAYHHEFSHAP